MSFWDKTGVNYAELGEFGAGDRKRTISGSGISKNPATKTRFHLFDNDPNRGQNIGPLGIKIPISRHKDIAADQLNDHLEFFPNQYSAKNGFSINWYDGYVDARFNRETWKLDKSGDEYNHPDEKVLVGMDFEKFGSVMIGEHGKLFFKRSGKNAWALNTDTLVDGFEWPEKSLPRAPGQDNYQEWYDAIQGKITRGEPHFGLAGPMTETILLGVLAQRVPGEKLGWNSDKMQIVDRPELSKYVRREYADGWSETNLLAKG